jgi:hypothetical protein
MILKLKKIVKFVKIHVVLYSCFIHVVLSRILSYVLSLILSNVCTNYTKYK